MTGTIFDVMKYAIHDGPGIRTIVFFKGCPLRCLWCHNPEGQAPGPELMLLDDRCIGCGACRQVCPHGAAGPVGKGGWPGRELCQSCLRCVDVCHAGARTAAGRTVTVEEVLAEVEKDAVFYEESGGGVTFSGGEPLMQPGFLGLLLAGCKAREMHTAVETTGYARRSDLLEISALTDLFLYDLKLMDDAAHQAHTGVSNRVILANLRELSRRHRRITVRVPIVPGVTDGAENLRRIGEFVAELDGVQAIHLLPYHKAGVEKYRRLGRRYELPDIAPPTDTAMSQAAAAMAAYGKPVQIGG